MADYKVFKETALPGSLTANAIYLVAPTARAGFVEIYVTNSAGDATRKVIDHTTVQNMIDAAMSAAEGGLVIVDDIDARDALSPDNGAQVLVVDASDDATVTSGAATYVWRESTEAWIKISEAESMDIQLTWSALTGKPSSSASQIDSAVTASHSHTNKTQLDKVGEDGSGNLTYGGTRPRQAWESTAW